MVPSVLDRLCVEAWTGDDVAWADLIGSLAPDRVRECELIDVHLYARAACLARARGDDRAWPLWEVVRRTVHSALCAPARIAASGYAVRAVAEAGRLYGADEWVAGAMAAMTSILAGDDRSDAARVGVIEGLIALDQARPFEPGWRIAAEKEATALFRAVGARVTLRRLVAIGATFDGMERVFAARRGEVVEAGARLVLTGVPGDPRLLAVLRAYDRTWRPGWSVAIGAATGAPPAVVTDDRGPLAIDPAMLVLAFRA